jgi:hypothetical protein
MIDAVRLRLPMESGSSRNLRGSINTASDLVAVNDVIQIGPQSFPFSVARFSAMVALMPRLRASRHTPKDIDCLLFVKEHLVVFLPPCRFTVPSVSIKP